MTFSKRSALALAAAALALQPSVVAAQASCITETQLSAMVVYSVPHALRALNTKCGAELARDGFLALHGREVSSRYAAYGDQSWPDAFSGLLVFASLNGVGQSGLGFLKDLPANTVRPLVNEIIAQKVLEQFKLDNCQMIERAMEAIAPLEPSEAGNLAAVIASISGASQPPVCPVS